MLVLLDEEGKFGMDKRESQMWVKNLDPIEIRNILGQSRMEEEVGSKIEGPVGLGFNGFYRSKYSSLALYIAKYTCFFLNPASPDASSLR